MKPDTHGIRFRFWLVCFSLAAGITLLIGILQIGLIRPYYRNSKVHAVSVVADTILSDLVEKRDSDAINHALKESVNNNVCVLMLNDRAEVLYEADSLGTGCLFHTSSFQEDPEIGTNEKMIATLDGVIEFSKYMTNHVTEQEMIVYGKKIESNLSNYYLFVNSPLEPVDSTVSFFMKQYGLYTSIAIIIASIVAFYMSSSLTKPIVSMKKEAQKLIRADYSAKFEGGSFTETKELAQTLNVAEERLAKIDELRRDLIANVSHDMRTPLTDIRAYAEMIRDISGDYKDKREKHLSVIIKETEYMNRLIGDMNELSQIQSGSYVLNRANMDLCAKIREVASLNGSLLENADLQLILEIPDSITVYADDIKIGQVISNYVSNAIKHSPKGSRIWIRAYVLADEETVRCEVEDEGDGIPADELPNIWDRYQKSSRTFRRNMTNTGLGLAIVKAILEAHHAKFGVQSEVGKGSLFYFELRETHEA